MKIFDYENACVVDVATGEVLYVYPHCLVIMGLNYMVKLAKRDWLVHHVGYGKNWDGTPATSELIVYVMN